jgi:hypothetical protein
MLRGLQHNAMNVQLPVQAEVADGGGHHTHFQDIWADDPREAIIVVDCLVDFSWLTSLLQRCADDHSSQLLKFSQKQRKFPTTVNY